MPGSIFFNKEAHAMAAQSKTTDDGYVVMDEHDMFYTGLGWSDQLRKAKIYHSPKWAKEVINLNPDRTCRILPVQIAVTGGPLE